MRRLAAIAVVTMLLAATCWLTLSSTRQSVKKSLPLTSERAAKSSASPAGNSTSPPSSIQNASQSRSATNLSLAAAKRTWDTNFLSTLGAAFEGKPIQFELLNGQRAVGRILRQQSSGAELLYVSGQLTEPAPGRFFFQKQSIPGIAGPFVGVIEFPTLGKAYRIEAAQQGSGSELVERPLHNVICMELPQPTQQAASRIAAIPPLNPGEFPTVPVPGYQNGIVVLESLAGAKPVIYLDFQGGYTETWGGVAYQRSGFGNPDIFEIWRRVSEDYMPFNINVTTDLKVFEKAPQGSRQRVIITPTDTAEPGAGGASYVGAFNWTGDTPCWVFVTEAAHYAAEACAHEAGHCLGLIHDGQQINNSHEEYFYGQKYFYGPGPNDFDTNTSWAPIMGVAYYDNVTQWSKGEYLYANNPEDQIRIIAMQNNVHLRPDDTGDTLATARYLEIYDDHSASAQGVIGMTDDTDAFRFSTTGGKVSLQANPVSFGANLAIMVSLYDASDTILVSNNPQDTLWASISTNLPAGTYTFRVTGAGRNDPLTNGFSSYASLGYYSITGRVANARQPNRFAIPEYAPIGTVVGVVPGGSPSTDTLSYLIFSGNASNTFAIDHSGTLTVANNDLLDYQALAQNTQLPVQFELFVNIVDGSQPSLSETNRRVLVAVTNVNEPPIISGFVSSNYPSSFSDYPSSFLGGPGLVNLFGLGNQGLSFGGFESSTSIPPQFSASVLDHSPAGTGIGTIIASDPDFYTLLSYSIMAGNSNGMFAIDNDTGTITVAGDPAAAVQNLYNLTILVSDQTPHLPLMATSMVSISVELPYQRGSIAFALYTNIERTSVTDLTNDSHFPLDPAFEDMLSSMEQLNIDQSSGFGGVMRGYLLPPATGTYTFWLASEDNGELWLSTSTNPAAMQRVAYISGDTNWAGPGNWTNYPSQQSAPISLSAGFAYYIEARFKAGTPANYLGVAWECADRGIPRQIVLGRHLAPFHMNYLPHPIGFNVNLARNAITGAQVGTVRVTDLNSDDVETLSLVSGNATGAFALDPATGAVRLMDETTLADTNRAQFTLTVQATDNGMPPLSSTTTVTINLAPANTILADSIAAEIWTNLPGNAISNLTSAAKFPRQPDLVQSLNSLELSSEFLGTPITFLTNAVFGSGQLWWSNETNGAVSGNNSAVSFQSSSPVATLYGARIRGYLTPTNTGLFTFFISSADDSILRLSSTTNLPDAQTIAWVSGAPTDPRQWTTYPSQQSPSLWLYAGTHHYFEILSKTGRGRFGASGGGLPVFGIGSYGHVEVGWTGPGLADTNVIDGAFLSPIDLEYPPFFPNRTVPLPITSANGSVITTLSAQASVAETLAYKIISGNLSNTFSINPYTGELSVNDNSSFANYAVSNFTLVVEVQDSGYGGLYPLSSALATISLPVVDNSPAWVWSGRADAADWSLASNWDRGLPNDRSKLIFLGTTQQTNHNDFLSGAGLVTLGIGGFYIDGNPLVLRGGLLNRGTNTWAIDSTLDGPQTFNAVSGALAIDGRVKTQGNELTLEPTSVMFLNGEVSGSGGLRELGGTLVVSSGNTYSGLTDINGTMMMTNAGSVSASSSINVRFGGILDVRRTAGIYTVPSGQTLTGNGIVVGPIMIQGNLAPTWPPGPGPSPLAMIFTNRLVLAGNTTLTISKTSPQNQTIGVVGELDYGGTLTVLTNRNESWYIGGALPNPPPFQLFKATKIVGTFTNLNLPPGFKWDITQLTNNGTIRLVGLAPIVLPIMPLVHTNSSVIIQFQSTIGAHYILESTLSLQPPVRWSQSVFRTGTGGILAIPFAAPEAVPQRFFRVKVN